ncbi:thiol oxidoreductase [Motiliproteus coralliicola]|uniref:Thiol oxidoreductase n=1 Tax=Motiliproteus coralliicola TaxID=2283196 RepID=A0A369W8J8_9GAMM|nr:di-heme oxidoredictase family protein [Motiliproteus coralliicola]RDE18318.1 thiol oxidoreductase [Motiliproteus coralliicola]
MTTATTTEAPAEKPSSSLFLKIGVGVLVVALSALGYQAYLTVWAPYAAYEDPDIMGYLEQENPKSLSGGDTTHFHSSSGETFAQEIPNMGWGLSAAFDRGDGFFERPLQAALPEGFSSNNDGLGPLYNAVTCEGCHPADGRGRPPMNEHEPLLEGFVRVSIPGTGPYGAPLSPPGYGHQLSDKSVAGVPPEATVRVKWVEAETGVLPGGETYSLRKPEFLITNLAYGPLPADTMYDMRFGPQVYGLGLLEAIKEEDMLAWADPDDADGDGISGRVNKVWDLERGGKVIGRFGWKANSYDVRQQSAEAAYNDMGMNNPLFLYRHDDQAINHKARQNCEPEQNACLEAIQGKDFEMTPAQLVDVTTYLQTLGVVYRRDVDDPVALKGEALFAEAGCGGCHKSNITTGETEIARLENQLIHPYTDLLLHDMGEGLKGRPDFEASPTEWRTQPLWGIGKVELVNGHTNFLHDGRARNIQEAILWHGGEAEQAKQHYRQLSKEDRQALLKFINSL